MREVGNTQVDGDGRLHTMLADPEELPQPEPALPAIPKPPPNAGRRAKSGPPAIALVGGIFAIVAVASFAVLWALGYEVSFGEDEPKKKPAAAAPAPPPPPAPA